MSYTKKTYQPRKHWLKVGESVSDSAATKRIDAGARRSPALNEVRTKVKLRGKVLKQRKGGR